MFKNSTIRQEILKKFSVGKRVAASVEIKTVGYKFVTCISYIGGYSKFKTSLQDFYFQHVV